MGDNSLGAARRETSRVRRAQAIQAAQRERAMLQLPQVRRKGARDVHDLPQEEAEMRSEPEYTVQDVQKAEDEVRTAW
jgi:hypothetical protein